MFLESHAVREMLSFMTKSLEKIESEIEMPGAGKVEMSNTRIVPYRRNSLRIVQKKLQTATSAAAFHSATEASAGLGSGYAG